MELYIFHHLRYANGYSIKHLRLFVFVSNPAGYTWAKWLYVEHLFGFLVFNPLFVVGIYLFILL